MRRTLLLLGGFWFLQLGTKGLILPYFSLYLSRIGLRESEVGWVLAMLPLTGLLAQPVWGTLADRTGRRRLVLAFLCLGAAAASLLLGRLSGFLPLLAGTIFFSLFETSLVPQNLSVSLGALGHAGRRAFGLVRSFGTLGVLCVVSTFPWVQPLLAGVWAPVGAPELAAIFPWAALLFLAAAALAARLPASQALTLRASPGDAPRLLRHPPIRRLLPFLFGIHLCIQGPMYLLPILVERRGGDVGTISGMWVLMLLVELPLVVGVDAIRRRLSGKGLILAALISESVRWGITAWADDLALLITAQALHGIGVIGILVGAPLYVEETVPERLRSTGQAWAAMAGPGAGTIASNALAGMLMESQGARLTYACSSATLALLLLLLTLYLPAPARPCEDPANDA